MRVPWPDLFKLTAAASRPAEAELLQSATSTAIVLDQLQILPHPESRYVAGLLQTHYSLARVTATPSTATPGMFSPSLAPVKLHPVLPQDGTYFCPAGKKDDLNQAATADTERLIQGKVCLSLDSLDCAGQTLMVEPKS